MPDSRLKWAKFIPDFRLKRRKTTPSGVAYTRNSIKDALAIGYWRLGIGHLSIHNNAITCLSEHQTIDSQCAITIA